MKTEFKIWLINYILAPFSWSKWTDILVFTYIYDGYLLQGRVNKRTNAKIFKVTPQKQMLTNAYKCLQMLTNANVIGANFNRLKEVGLIDESVKFN